MSYYLDGLMLAGICVVFIVLPTAIRYCCWSTVVKTTKDETKTPLLALNSPSAASTHE
jgi:hypothetical protein